MRKLKTFLPAGLILLATLGAALEIAAQSKYVPVSAYDPKRDAGRDSQEAIAEAQRTHKRILLEVGGNWCSWCHTLDGFFDSHKELLALRERNFVTVKINFSE